MILFGRSLTEEEIRRVKRKCNRSRTAFESCLLANKDDPNKSKICRNLEWSFDHCQSSVVCPQQAKEYERCVFKAVSADELGFSGSNSWYTRCEKTVNSMKKCLRKHRMEQQVWAG
eukprot:jgi/Picsp_1/1824/NSC_05291-R1_hypothetical protein CHLNCDRAFT_55161 [Chlorella variabilis]